MSVNSVNTVQSPAVLKKANGSQRVSFNNQQAGAATRTLESKLAESVSVTDFGALGNGTSYAEDNAAFVAAVAYLKTRGGGRLWVPDPPDFYEIDPLQIDFDNCEIWHESKNTHVKLRPQDFAVLTNTGLYQPHGAGSADKLQGFKCVGGLLDGNKGNHINEVENPHVDHEVIDLKHCISPEIHSGRVINAHSEGVDIDSSVGAIVQMMEVENCGGWGIHNSVDSTHSIINYNRVINCGHDKLRGGIDGFKAVGIPALYGRYSGNYCQDNYQNYNVQFNDDTNKLKTHYFDASNVSAGTTVIDDSVSGAAPTRIYSDTPSLIFDRGYNATGANFYMPDANTLELREYKESESKDVAVLTFKLLGGGGIDIPHASGGIDISPASGTKWRFKRNGADGFLEAMNDEGGSMERVFAIDKDGDIHLNKAGKGLVLVSPDGLTTRKLTIDNSGNLAITGV